MKVIIDIDDEDYKRIQDINSAFNGFTARLYSIIRKGTPLPEHHGRIIDESKINQLYKYTEEQISYDTKVIYQIKKRTDAPTIIEADKE